MIEIRFYASENDRENDRNIVESEVVRSKTALQRRVRDVLAEHHDYFVAYYHNGTTRILRMAWALDLLR